MKKIGFAGMERDDDKSESVRSLIVDCIGEEKFNQLAAALGGRDFKMPKPRGALRDDHELVLAIGLEDAIKLCNEFFGARIYIPHHVKADRGAEYVDAVGRGMTNREIAISFKVSERQVRRQLAKLGISNPNYRIRLASISNSNGGLTVRHGETGIDHHPANGNRSSGL